MFCFCRKKKKKHYLLPLFFVSILFLLIDQVLVIHHTTTTQIVLYNIWLMFLPTHNFQISWWIVRVAIDFWIHLFWILFCLKLFVFINTHETLLFFLAIYLFLLNLSLCNVKINTSDYFSKNNKKIKWSTYEYMFILHYNEYVIKL